MVRRIKRYYEKDGREGGKRKFLPGILGNQERRTRRTEDQRRSKCKGVDLTLLQVVRLLLEGFMFPSSYKRNAIHSLTRRKKSPTSNSTYLCCAK